MSVLTLFGACAVTIMLISYALEKRSSWWVVRSSNRKEKMLPQP